MMISSTTLPLLSIIVNKILKLFLVLYIFRDIDLRHVHFAADNVPLSIPNHLAATVIPLIPLVILHLEKLLIIQDLFET